MLEKLPQDQKIIGTHWLFTWKAPGIAKARLVVQGCQEKSSAIRGDAPTASRDAMMMVFLFGSQKHWSLGQYDAECAYLQSEGLGRSLLLRMPDPAPPTKYAGEVVAATGAIYGTKDAGRKWYFHLKATLAKHGIYESSLEKGTYRMFKNGGLVMIMHTQCG